MAWINKKEGEGITYPKRSEEIDSLIAKNLAEAKAAREKKDKLAAEECRALAAKIAKIYKYSS
jgi:hypothetical protein